MQTGIVDSKLNTQNVKVHDYNSRFFFTSGKETIKYIKNQSSSSHFSLGKGHNVRQVFLEAVT